MLLPVPSRLSRRSFLALVSGAGALGGATLLAACASSSGKAATATEAAAATTPAHASAMSSSVAALPAAASGPTAMPPTALPGRAAIALSVWEEDFFHFESGLGQELVAPLFAPNSGLTLQTTVANNNQQKFLAAVSGGVPPDVFSTGSYQVQQHYVDGATIVLDRYLARSTNISKEEIWPSLLRDVVFKGYVTGMPYAPDTRVLYTRSDLAQKVGLDPNAAPRTWSALQAEAQKAYQGTGTTVQHAGWDPFWGSGGNLLWMVPYWQLGGELTNADETKVTFHNDQAITSLTWLKSVVDAQGGWQALEAYRKTFKSCQGEQIMLQGGSTFLYATLSVRSETFKVQEPTMPYTISLWPLPDQGGVASTYGGCHTFVIARGSKHPDAAWQFVEQVVTPENNIRSAVASDRVPIRQAATSSDAYVQGDPARALQAQQMSKRRFVIAAPGGTELLQYEDVVTPSMTGKQSAQEALQTQQQLAQTVLDQYLTKAAQVKPGQ